MVGDYAKKGNNGKIFFSDVGTTYLLGLNIIFHKNLNLNMRHIKYVVLTINHNNVKNIF